MNKNHIVRLKEIINYFDGGNFSAFARRISVSAQTLNKYLSGDRTPGNIFKAKLRELGINIEWFDTGKGEMFVSKEAKRISEPILDISIFPSVKAGEPIECWEHDIDKLSLPKHLLKGIKNPIGFKISGDSMKELILDNDIIIAEEIQLDQIRNRDIVIVSINNSTIESREGLIKIFEWIDKEKGDFILLSYNVSYHSQRFNKKQILKIFRYCLLIRQKIELSKL